MPPRPTTPGGYLRSGRISDFRLKITEGCLYSSPLLVDEKKT